MLNITRRVEEEIVIDGRIRIKICRIKGQTQVILGIDAPREVEIVRGELLEEKR